MIHTIVAINKKNGIGKGNDLLYRMPEDLKRFKRLTTGHTVIMGRKTYASLPNGALPNRRNIVISSTLTSLPDAEVYPSIATALAKCSEAEDIFMIGGASIYKEALPLTDILHLTTIEDELAPADTFFPTINYSEWELIEETYHPADEKHLHAYKFSDYKRIK